MYESIMYESIIKNVDMYIVVYMVVYLYKLIFK